MKLINVKTQLESFIITDLNYKYNESIFSFFIKQLKDVEDLNTESKEAYQFASNIKEKTSIKIAIHPAFEDLLVIMDTQVQEVIDTEPFHELIENPEEVYVLKDLEISIEFRFSLDIPEVDLSALKDTQDDFKKNIVNKLKKSATELCRQQMMETIKSLTSLDYNKSIRIDPPTSEIEINIS